MRYPIGIQDFESIRRDGFVYVDKTELIYNLVFGSGKYYFLSRPRRFGKSLLISTMEAYFKGKKELFEGLAMADLEKEWKAYPVLRFDLSGKEYREPCLFIGCIDHILETPFGRLEARRNPVIRFKTHQMLTERFCQIR